MIYLHQYLYVIRELGEIIWVNEIQSRLQEGRIKEYILMRSTDCWLSVVAASAIFDRKNVMLDCFINSIKVDK